MPYYHIRVKRIGKRPSYIYEFDISKKKLGAFFEQARKGGPLYLPKSLEWINERNIEDIDIAKTPKKSSFYGIGRLKGKRIFDEGKIVTSQFIKKPLPRKVMEKSIPEVKLTHKVPSKNVFIVHGKDKNSVKELKTILGKFGLKPIVLHEQPGGSRTIVEKLEKYSDVGYAFVILTPDDSGCEKVSTNTATQWAVEIEYFTSRSIDITENKILRNRSKEVVRMLKSLRDRARQNVILEFGYFIGLLGRDRVCCLYKGDVELPSDMHGIVYIPFKESVKECLDEIIKELKAVGYEIQS